MKRWLLASTLLVSAGAAAFPVELLQSSGPSDNRIDLVVLGDGYAQGAQAKLTQDAQALVTGLFGLTPYKEYRGLFNVKLIKSVSNQDGADHPSTSTYRDTLFDAAYECFGIDRLICVDTAKVLSAAAADVPEFDIVLVLVNDPLYGGSGGTVPVASVASSSVEILQHELAHNLAGLADEYESPYPGYPACSTVSDCPEPNATLRSVRDQVKWNAWIAASTPVPTPENGTVSGVGVFEGGRYLPSGLYRPVQEACAMRTLGAPFCPVCAEGLVRSFWNRVRPIDSFTPPMPEVTLCGAATFQVGHPTVEQPSWSYVWTLDGAPQSGSLGSLTLSPSLLGAAPRSLQVTVQDGTALVRADPQSLLRDTAGWSLGTADCGAYACAPDGLSCRTSCSGGGDCAANHVCEDTRCVRSDGGTPSPPDGGTEPVDGGTPSGPADAGGSNVPGPDDGDDNAEATSGCGCQGKGAGLGPLCFLAALAGLGIRVSRSPV